MISHKSAWFEAVDLRMSVEQYEKDEASWRKKMILAQQGDKQSYEALLGELSVVIEMYLRRHFGTLDILEDAVQECLILIHRARHTYNPDKLFRPWLFTIVRHRMIDLLREKNCRIQLYDAKEQADIETKTSDAEKTHQLIDGIKVLGLLKPSFREAITLTKYIGMTTFEAANKVGISESAMKARLRRALIEVHQKLKIEEY